MDNEQKQELAEHWAKMKASYRTVILIFVILLVTSCGNETNDLIVPQNTIKEYVCKHTDNIREGSAIYRKTDEHGQAFDFKIISVIRDNLYTIIMESINDVSVRQEWTYSSCEEPLPSNLDSLIQQVVLHNFSVDNDFPQSADWIQECESSVSAQLKTDYTQFCRVSDANSPCYYEIETVTDINQDYPITGLINYRSYNPDFTQSIELISWSH